MTSLLTERPVNSHAPDTARKARKSHLAWVELGACIVSLHAQGNFKPAHAAAIAARFDLEAVGFPVVSLRDGCYYLIDGQHRVKGALLFGFSETDKLQMEVYEGLTEAEEAELFLERNSIKAKSAWDKYHVAITAGRDEECAIDRCVRAQNLAVAPHRSHGTIAAINPLRKLFRMGGGPLVSKTVRVARDAYGERGFDGPVIEGIGLFFHRYGSAADEALTIERLAKTPGGLNGLVLPAEKLRQSMGENKPTCIAAQIAVLYNRGQGGKKLAPWWKQ